MTHPGQVITSNETADSGDSRIIVPISWMDKVGTERPLAFFKVSQLVRNFSIIQKLSSFLAYDHLYKVILIFNFQSCFIVFF